MRRTFGWSLPPGTTQAMIDAQCEDLPCLMCGLLPDDCICPECPKCAEQGNPKCYEKHGLKTTKEQRRSLRIAQLTNEINLAKENLAFAEQELTFIQNNENADPDEM